MNESTRIERYDVVPIEVLKQIPGVTDEIAEKVRAVLAEELDPCEASEDARIFWERCCYNRPDPKGYELKLKACADLLGMYDVASLDIEGARAYTDEGIRMCPPFSYCNAGDTYIPTLARDHAAGQWVVACWGDLAEDYEQENELGAYQKFDSEPDRCPDCIASSFTLKSFERGDWVDGKFVTNGVGYVWVCNGCAHHCTAADDFVPET